MIKKNLLLETVCYTVILKAKKDLVIAMTTVTTMTRFIKKKKII